MKKASKEKRTSIYLTERILDKNKNNFMKEMYAVIKMLMKQFQ